jgi:hypothetical protein
MFTTNMGRRKMPNKDWNKLWPTDDFLRRLFGTRMWKDNETICTIRMFGGFEFFNTRPYHNYETWSDGYEVSSPLYDIKVTAEDLDDALRIFQRKVFDLLEEKKRNGEYSKYTDVAMEALPCTCRRNVRAAWEHAPTCVRYFTREQMGVEEVDDE